MKFYNIKDFFGNYMTFENRINRSILWAICQSAQCVLIGVSIAILLIIIGLSLFWLLITILG